ncbi:MULTISPECIES: MlaD family protein [unclassified Nocardioides]|uniref:MlaD family protein n=1 Tax=unclassified Nocardioides TaxID=2615069 RepID=UPI0006F701B5|nr:MULTISPECIES: MlaD family protein [unclassified Nocardioides]KQY64129.1 hypothetical protein ASD30_03975 [Nocardioides sp. Root140]KRF16147.1 hypothetical protein ASH02_06005 [Nocardioides sp. Soil796]
MKNKAAAKASLGKLIFGAAVLAGVLVACLVLLFAWILQAPIGKQKAEITVTMPRTGGLFEGSSASYRGVEVGEVKKIELDGSGVKVTVDLKSGVEIPADVVAKVRSLSPVGEQYIDFRPNRTGGPYLADGDRVSATADDLPVSLAKMVSGLQAAMRQVDPDKVRTVLREVNTAFAGSGDDLRKLLANTETLLDTVDTTWPTAERVLTQGRTTLKIFADNRQLLVDWAASAATVGTWFVQWNPDVRAILSRMPGDLADVMVLIDGVDHRLPGLLKNVNPLTKFLALRGPHLQATLSMTPYGLGRFASVMYNGYMNVTASLQKTQPYCNYGTDRGSPTEGTGGRDLYLNGHCTGSAPWRGANHAPAPLTR